MLLEPDQEGSTLLLTESLSSDKGLKERVGHSTPSLECVNELRNLAKCETNVESILPSLAQVLHLFKAENNSQTLFNAKSVLGELNESGIIWTIQKPFDEHLWARFLQLYMSIPDRVANAFEIGHGFDPLLPRNFLKTLANTMYKCHLNLNRVPLIVAKSHSIGGIPVLLEVMIQQNFTLYILECLKKIPFVQMNDFTKELFNSLHVNIDDPIKLLRYMTDYFHEESILKRIASTIPLLLPDIPETVFCCIMKMMNFDFIISVLKPFLYLWSVRCDIITTPLCKQRQMTKLLLIMLSFCSFDQLCKASLESHLLEGIQKRLDSTDHDIIIMGQVTAECFATLTFTESKLNFELAGPIVNDLRGCFGYGRVLDERLADLQGWPIVKGLFDWTPESKATPTVEDFQVTEPIVKGLDHLPPPCSTSNNDDDLQPIMTVTKSDKEARNVKIKRPRFLRECLAYLKCNDDPIKVELALNELGSLINSSSSLLREEIGMEIYQSVLYLGEDFDIKEFDSLRREALGLIVFKVPLVIGPCIMKEVMGRSATVRQKLETIVSCMTAIKICNTKPKNNPDIQLEIRMKIFNEQMGFNLTRSNPKDPIEHIQVIVKRIIIPLLSIVNNAQSFPFNSNNTGLLILEKMVYLTAYSLSNAASLPDFPLLIRKALAFLHPILSSSVPPSRPVLRATILTIHSIVTLWPESLPVIENVQEYILMASFLENNHQIIIDLDTDYLTLTGSALLKIQERTNPLNLLEEASVFIELDDNEIRICPPHHK